MNKYDEYFCFRVADRNDIEDIMRFISEVWDSEHILANNRDFFLYHYGGVENRINVFLMCNKKGIIDGMIGFVRYSEDKDKTYISSSITKVREKLPLPMCGLELMKRFYSWIPEAREVSCGANPKTIKPLFERVFHYRTGRMSQYVCINQIMEKYHFITIPDEMRMAHIGKSALQMKLKKRSVIKDVEFDFTREYPYLPYRSKEYVDKRYFQHPLFRYDSYEVWDECECRGMLFTRIVEFENSRIMLITDYMGEVECLAHISESIETLLVHENAECASLLIGGESPDLMNDSGFFKLDAENGKVIVPTYVEPYVNKNIESYYISSEKDLIVFKAYGDQDNPRYAGLYLSEGDRI